MLIRTACKATEAREYVEGFAEARGGLLVVRLRARARSVRLQAQSAVSYPAGPSAERVIFGAPAARRAEPLPAAATRLGTADNQIGNFLDCVRSRRQPVCHVGVGHHSANVCHIGNIAIRTNQRLRWDPEQERFVGHAEANQMLSRPMRGPWRLEPVPSR